MTIWPWFMMEGTLWKWTNFFSGQLLALTFYNVILPRLVSRSLLIRVAISKTNLGFVSECQMFVFLEIGWWNSSLSFVTWEQKKDKATCCYRNEIRYFGGRRPSQDKKILLLKTLLLLVYLPVGLYGKCEKCTAYVQLYIVQCMIMDRNNANVNK